MKKKVHKKKEYFGKKTKFVFRIVFSIFLGFLPSFVFTFLFVQYGSPISNYAKFLSNINSSWISWLSAMIIFVLMNFIKKNTKSTGYFEKIKKNKILFISLIFGFALIFVLILVQSYLYVNFLLRNDVLVRLSADHDSIFFTDNLNEEVSFKTSAITNPFCQVECRYSFFDISNGKEIEAGTFNLISVSSKTKKYSLINNHLVQGSQALVRFEVGCKSKKTLLCYTKEEESKRAILITINYNLSQEDANFKNSSNQRITFLLNNFSFVETKLNESKNNLFNVNDSFLTDNFKKELGNLSILFMNLNNSILYSKKLWEIQNFTSLRGELINAENKSKFFNLEYEKFNLNLISNISFYNNLTEELIKLGQTLDDIKSNNLDDSLCLELNALFHKFNIAVLNFQGNRTLSGKQIILESLLKEVNTFQEKMQNNPIASSCLIVEDINLESISKIPISLIEPVLSNFSLSEPSPICCFLGKCRICCDDDCSKENYPVIFLHGHTINKELPADYSLDTFTNIKEKLVQENYIDAGAIITSLIAEPKGLLGKVNEQIIITGSYFFDTSKTSSGEITISSADVSIDTYAMRLKNLVDTMKYRTNKDKVIIVAHSMGGLVTRRYIQIFGAQDVDR
ncbi:MAG: hypothetical protein AABW47_01530, partial [Nanoarchaeota archaeon]